MRLIGLAAAALVAVAACSTRAAEPSIRPAAPPPDEAEPTSVVVEDARTWLVDRGFRCAPLDVEAGSAIRCVGDDRRAGGPYLVVDVLGDAGGLVTLVQATVDVSEADEPDLAGFLGFYAVTVFGIVADGTPRAIDAWLRAHTATAGSTAVGGFVLEMQIEPARSSLRIWQRA